MKNWKLYAVIALYVFLAYAVPDLRPAHIAQSLAIFAHGVAAGLHQQ